MEDISKIKTRKELVRILEGMKSQNMGARATLKYYNFVNSEAWYQKDKFFSVFNHLETIQGANNQGKYTLNTDENQSEQEVGYWSYTFSINNETANEINYRLKNLDYDFRTGANLPADNFTFKEEVYNVETVTFTEVNGSRIINDDTVSMVRQQWVDLPGKNNKKSIQVAENAPVFIERKIINDDNFEYIIKRCKEYEIDRLKVERVYYKPIEIKGNIVHSELNKSIADEIVRLGEKIYSLNFTRDFILQELEIYLSSYENIKSSNKKLRNPPPTFRLVEEREDFRIILSYNKEGGRIQLGFSAKETDTGTRKGNSRLMEMYGPELDRILVRRNSCSFYKIELNNNFFNYNNPEGFSVDFNTNNWHKRGTHTFNRNASDYQFIFGKQLLKRIYLMMGKDVNGRGALIESSEIKAVKIGKHRYQCIDASRHYVFPDLELFIQIEYHIKEDDSGRKYLLCETIYNATPYVSETYIFNSRRMPWM